MLFILLIGYFVQACIAVRVNPGQISIEQSEQSRLLPSVNPISRWIQLNNQIFEANISHGQISLANVKQILLEMSLFEQTELFKSALKPIDVLLGHHFKHYRYLVRSAYDSNLLDKSDATITDLLLQTFNHDSNDCTKAYFDQLNDIYNEFEQTPIGKALRENYQLQVQNCWTRSEGLLSITMKRLGSRVMQKLNQLLEFIYPNNSDEIIQFNTDHLDYCVESARLAEKIDQYLRKQQLTHLISSDQSKLKHFIFQPCTFFITELKDDIMKIMSLIELGKMKENDTHMISSEHKKILNKYLVCERIVADEYFIRSIVSHFSLLSTSDINEIQGNLTSNNVVTQTNDTRNQFEDGQLITQQFDSANAFDQSEASSQMQENFGPLSSYAIGMDTNVVPFEPLTTRYSPSPSRMAVMPESNPNVDKVLSRVVSIDKPTGRGLTARYKTHWSDGRTSIEKKSYLDAHWPDQLEELHQRLKEIRKSKYIESRAKYLSRKKPVEPINASFNIPVAINANLRKVSSIERAIGRGAYARYPTHWSDGSTSLETKEFLHSHWPVELRAALKDVAHQDYINYIARCRNRSKSEIHEMAAERKRARATKESQKQRRIRMDPSPGYQLNRPANSTVVSVENRTTRRDLVTKYLTNWADGTKTMEDREYLCLNWPQAWAKLSRDQSDLRRSKKGRRLAYGNVPNKQRKVSHESTIEPNPESNQAPVQDQMPIQPNPSQQLNQASMPSSFMDLLRYGSADETTTLGVQFDCQEMDEELSESSQDDSS